MTTTVKIRFRVAYYTAAVWTAQNPVLLAGETGVESDTRKEKIGDGTTAWTALPYSFVPLGAGLAAIDGLTPAADRVPYFTGPAGAALAVLTAFGRSVIAAVDAAAARLVLGLGALAVKSTVNDADWSGADLTIANGGTGSSSAPAARTALGLGTMATQSAGAVAVTGGSIKGISIVGVNVANPLAASHIYYGSGAPSLSAPTGAIQILEGTSTLRVITGTDPTSPYSGWCQASDQAGSAYPLTFNPLGGGVGFGTLTPRAGTTVDVAGLLCCDSLWLDQTPVAEAVTSTHTLTITVADGSTFKLLLA